MARGRQRGKRGPFPGLQVVGLDGVEPLGGGLATNRDEAVEDDAGPQSAAGGGHVRQLLPAVAGGVVALQGVLVLVRGEVPSAYGVEVLPVRGGREVVAWGGDRGGVL